MRFLTYLSAMERHSQIRLYVTAPLFAGAEVILDKEQAHYLGTVMRKSVGTKLAVFNGKDGCYVAEVTEISRKSAQLTILSLQETQWASPDIWLLFAPVKKARLDFMAQKATELGASVIWPVRTDFTQVKAVKDDRLLANAIEAAEQTERLDIPDIRTYTDLSDILASWPDDRALIFCDERLAESHRIDDHDNTPSEKSDHFSDALRNLSQINSEKAAILIGPEGGFSMTEKQMIDDMPQSCGISLGPRILRADTAAIAALSLYQVVCGDWPNSSPIKEHRKM